MHTTLSADYCIDRGIELMTRADFVDYAPITLKVYEKAIQLKSDFKNQLDKVVEQLNSSIKTLIDG